jgi:hypothetical protein
LSLPILWEAFGLVAGAIVDSKHKRGVRVVAASVLKMMKGASTRRTFEDFPEWVAACAKLREISDEYNSLCERQKSINGTISEIERRRVAAIDVAVKARLESTQKRAALIEDRDRLDFEINVARGVLAQQSDIVHEIESRCAAEILKDVRPAHEQLVRNTMAALIALADAFDAESEFTTGLARDRVSVSSLPAIPYRIRQAVGSRTRWSSGVNEGDRIVSAYLGEKWDYSRVTA